MILYVKNLTLREIGDVLGVSEPRLPDPHAAQKSLKQQLAAEESLLRAVGEGARPHPLSSP